MPLHITNHLEENMTTLTELKRRPSGWKIKEATPNLLIVESRRDLWNWGNATATEPAFLVYLGCSAAEAPKLAASIARFYRCEVIERAPKRISGYERELKIRGMKRWTDTAALGLDSLVRSQELKTGCY
jgi:hypothetical protein